MVFCISDITIMAQQFIDGERIEDMFNDDHQIILNKTNVKIKMAIWTNHECNLEIIFTKEKGCRV
jgi:hypothetical protein